MHASTFALLCSRVVFRKFSLLFGHHPFSFFLSCVCVCVVARFIYETEHFNGVAELLEILGRLVSLHLSSSSNVSELDQTASV